MHDIIKRTRDASEGGPLLFYMRFFLHSIPEETQEALMTALSEAAQDGDMIAAEFRTEKDKANKKVYGNHYRRYQDGWAFGAALRDRYGFDVDLEGKTPDLPHTRTRIRCSTAWSPPSRTPPEEVRTGRALHGRQVAVVVRAGARVEPVTRHAKVVARRVWRATVSFSKRGPKAATTAPTSSPIGLVEVFESAR